MSFGAEMKDFISAAQAGQKMAGAADDAEYNKVKKKYLEAQTETINQKNNDPEGDAADLALKQARVRNVNGATALQGLRGQLTRAQLKAMEIANQPGAIPTSASIVPATTPMDGGDEAPVQAVPASPKPAPPVQTLDDVPDRRALTPPEQAVQSLAYRNGGAVQHFAGGGAVGEEEPTDDGEEADDGGGETTGGAGGVPDGAPTDISAARRGTPSFSTAAAIDGVHAGLTYGARALGLHQAAGIPTSGRTRAGMAWSSGAHAAPPEDMDKIKQSIDPDNKLPESSRNLAAIGAVYQFKMNHGDTDGAAKAAFQMIQHYRQASQRYAVIAAAAAQKGDLDTATHAAMKAYANVPDGQNFQVQKTPDGQLSYTITDEKTGKVRKQGLESPEKLASSAMGFAQNGFDESLMAAVQQRPAQSKTAVDPNSVPIKTADKTASMKGINAAYDEQNPDDEKTKAPKYNPADARDLKGAAYRAYNHPSNSRVTPEEAMDAATKIADPTSLDQAGFATKKADGGYQVRMGKKDIFMPEADFNTLMEKRAAKLASLKPKAGADEPGVISQAAGAVGNYLSGIRERNKAQLAAKDFKEPQIP